MDDIDAKVKLIEEAGGFIVDPPLELPGGSRICLFNEPSGVTLAMIQAAKEEAAVLTCVPSALGSADQGAPDV